MRTTSPEPNERPEADAFLDYIGDEPPAGDEIDRSILPLYPAKSRALEDAMAHQKLGTSISPNDRAKLRAAAFVLGIPMSEIIARGLDAVIETLTPDQRRRFEAVHGTESEEP